MWVHIWTRSWTAKGAFLFRPSGGNAWEALDDGTANEVYEKNKIFFSNAEECTLDAQGRFTLNARLKDCAGMENGSTVIMQGHKRTIEIWTNEGFNTMFNGLRTDTNFLDLMDAGKKAKPASEEQTAGV